MKPPAFVPPGPWVLAARLVSLILAFWLILSPSKGWTAVPTKPLKVGLTLDNGGRDDKSFNAAAFKGATEAEKKLKVKLKVVEASDDTSYEPSFRTFARLGYDLIIGIGFSQRSAMEKVAKEFPQVSFALIDSTISLPNVRSITFNEHEGSYLVGAIAALTSKTKTIGFIGGMDVPLIRRFEMGYEAGGKAIDKQVKVLVNYVGSGSDAWRNPTKAKELAMSQYRKKADVVFTAAGASGIGVFDAAEELKKYVIGVDSNQNWMKPGRVLTSMVKRVDLAVFDAIELKNKGKFEAGQFTRGLSDGGVNYAVDEHNKGLLTPSILKTISELKTKIIQGKIKVPDYYEANAKRALGSS